MVKQVNKQKQNAKRKTAPPVHFSMDQHLRLKAKTKQYKHMKHMTTITHGTPDTATSVSSVLSKHSTILRIENYSELALKCKSNGKKCNELYVCGVMHVMCLARIVSKCVVIYIIYYYPFVSHSSYNSEKKKK
eukprot:276846_1